MTVIQTVLMCWGHPLAPILYIQLDNTGRENKNATVFGYLSMLVNQGLFRKVKVNFLLAGHTHDHFDQMFSTSEDSWAKMILSHYILDVGEENVKVLAQLNNISFNHVFLLKQNETSGCQFLLICNFLWSKTNVN